MGEGKKQRPHILLHDTYDTSRYTSPKSPRDKLTIPRRERRSHAELLLAQLRAIHAKAAKRPPIQAVGVGAPTGFVLEFRGAPSADLKTDSLELQSQGIELLNVRQEAQGVRATVYVPDGKLEQFVKRVEAYGDENKSTKTGKPMNEKLAESISSVRLAAIEAMWCDHRAMPDLKAEGRFEVWVREGGAETFLWDRFLDEARRIGLRSTWARLRFPERNVTEVIGTLEQMGSSTVLLNCMTEIRLARDLESTFLRGALGTQGAWVTDLRDRLRTGNLSNVRVGLLDSGVNHGHALLANLLDEESVSSYHPKWGSHDHLGHGTAMAGLIGLGDLTEALSSDAEIHVRHRLESVKVLRPETVKGDGGPFPSGVVYAESVGRLETMNRETKRVYFSAITSSSGESEGLPTAWSAAIDQLASGAEDENRRLFVLAAGNSEPSARHTFPKNLEQSIHDPAQSWNALTVGACTFKTTIDPAVPTYHSWVPLAGVGELSPATCTSRNWKEDWPLKPDLVFEGGNMARNALGEVDYVDGLNLLSTHHLPFATPLTATGDTSGAAALVARMAAEIWAEYPSYWAETIRALLVHSASWTEAMKAMVTRGKIKKADAGRLLRLCGYGVPDLARATWSAANSLNLVIQAEISPFRLEGSEVKTNDMHFHKLPWPTSVLRDLHQTPVEMRVTLSYFIEPSPGQRGWTYKQGYSSHGLRFAVKPAYEKVEDFEKRINKARWAKEEKVSLKGDPDPWVMGEKLRTKGSICSDVWRGTAADLAQQDHIAVVPVGGWWKERKHLGRWGRRSRYSLIVSIHAPEESMDVYTPVANIVGIET